MARTRSPRQEPGSPNRVATVAAGTALLFALLAAFVLQHGALRAPFFADDYLFLDQVRGRGLADALTSPDPLGNFFRPIGRAFHFWAWARVGGESPLVLHAVNLGLALLSIALLFAIARRLAGVRAAAVAATFLALHHALDVPVRWASGSQDLLAFAGALGSIALLQRGAARLAGGALLVGLLSKETVALTPLIAVVVARVPGEPWSRSVRRAIPMIVAVVVWAMVWMINAGSRAGGVSALDLNPMGVPAALVQLVRAVFGIEWRAGRGWAMPSNPLTWIALAFAVTGVATAAFATARAEAKGAARAFGAGLLWAVCGALPGAPVATIWSAYFFLFAVAGAGLALGGLLSRAPAWLAVAAVAVFGITSDGARRLDEFATARGMWTAQSHVNRFYLDRAMKALDRNVGAMKRAYPTMAPRTTVFFAGLPSFIGLQAADGPLVRWAWRDTSLRSYYVTDFTRERASRGPVVVLVASGDTLRAMPGDDLLPLELAFTSMLSERIPTAREALAWRLDRAPDDAVARTWAAWLAWTAGDSAEGRAQLERAGVGLGRDGGAKAGHARRWFAGGDTVEAVALARGVVREHALDADAHGTLADLLLASNAPQPEPAIEAFAARVLAPEVAWHWWRWAVIQARFGRDDEATTSLARYFELGGADPTTNEAAQQLREQLSARRPGSEQAQRSLRE